MHRLSGGPRVLSKRKVSVGVVALVSAVCPTALADSSADVAVQAQALFDQAKAMMEKGDFAGACPLLAKSEELDPKVGTMLNLALCYEGDHKPAHACSSWLGAAMTADRKNQADRKEYALESAARNCARAQRLTVEVAPQATRDRLRVTIDEVPLAREQWGAPAPVDPGVYELRATGPGVEPWSATITVADNATVVTVPALTPMAEPRRWAEPGRPDRALMQGAIAAGAAGVVALGIGSAFGVAAYIRNKASSDQGNCVTNNCNLTGKEDRDQAAHDAQISDVAFAVGGGALATAFVLWILHQRGDAMSPRGVQIQPAIGRGAWSLSLTRGWQ